MDDMEGMDNARKKKGLGVNGGRFVSGVCYRVGCRRVGQAARYARGPGGGSPSGGGFPAEGELPAAGLSDDAPDAWTHGRT